MPYLVRFQRNGATVLKSEHIESLLAAHAFARERQNQVAADIIVIAELDENGEETRNKEIVKL